MKTKIQFTNKRKKKDKAGYQIILPNKIYDNFIKRRDDAKITMFLPREMYNELLVKGEAIKDPDFVSNLEKNFSINILE